MSQVLTPAEVGRRIKIVRCAADLSGKALGEMVGKEGDNAAAYISDLERGRRETPPHPRTLADIAEAVVGRGDLPKDQYDPIYSFLLGVAPSLTITPRPQLTSVEGEGRDAAQAARRSVNRQRRSARPQADKGYFRFNRFHLRLRVA